MESKKIAIIGGGINGLCTAWQLAQEGYEVTLFEKGNIMEQTSQASSKLLHGGLRYLQNFEFRLVREALHERDWWLQHVPSLTKRLPILYPIYTHSKSRLKIKLGLMLYDFLAGKKSIGRHRWLNPEKTLRCSPGLKKEGLKGAYLFFDGQMDDRALGLWVADQCRQLGVKILENTEVSSISESGTVTLQQEEITFNAVINVSGPWAAKLLKQARPEHKAELDLVRGSHLLLPPISQYGHMLEVPHEERIVFALPFKEQTLLGTTEVRQTIDEPIVCSDEERDYLLEIYNKYFDEARTSKDILSSYAGLRPLLTGADSASKASREYQFIQLGKTVHVFGGKWTTSRALALKVSQTVLNILKM